MWPKRPNAFGLTRNGIELEALRPSNAIDAGIRQSRDWPDMVPPFEEYSAMVTANYNEDAWRGATWETRARAVAFYRLSRMKALHEDDARIKHAKRKSGKR